MHPSARQRLLARFRFQHVALLYLIAIAFSEVVTALLDPPIGVLCHVVIFCSLLVYATVVDQPWKRAFLLSLTLAPLIRIVSLGMPLGIFPQEWWYALTCGPLFVASYVLARTIPLNRRQISLQLPRWRHLPATMVVTLSGAGLGWIEYQILRPAPLVHSLTFQSLLLPSVILIVGTGMVEELIFRGILQATTAEVFSPWSAIVYVSVLFGVLHTGHMSVLDVIFVIPVAIYFAWVVRRTHSLVGVSLAHGLTNIMLFLILPLFHL